MKLALIITVLSIGILAGWAFALLFGMPHLINGATRSPVR